MTFFQSNSNRIENYIEDKKKHFCHAVWISRTFHGVTFVIKSHNKYKIKLHNVPQETEKSIVQNYPNTKPPCMKLQFVTLCGDLENLIM